eukprot:gene36560-47631_t
MCAEDYLHRKPVPNLPNGSTMDDSNGVITRAVIGVPANFSEARKRVLRHAATLAGFDDVHLMVESTAAAMAYGLLVAGSKMILIFDMGGGTLDLSAMAVSDGCFEVLAMGGHGTCGGRAMDTLLMRHVVGRAVAASNTSGKNINTLSSVEVIIESLNSTQKDTLLLLCRTCKYYYSSHYNHCHCHCHSFSECEQSRVREDNIGGETVWVLDEVVLVGGASRIPAVRETLRKAMGAAGEEKFSPTGKGVLCTSISPDEAVAQGLAIRG